MTPGMADRMTTDHEEIRRWVEAHGGRLATVHRTRNGDPGALRIARIASPGGAGEESPEAISWAEWFRRIDENWLAFLDQDEKASGVTRHLIEARAGLPARRWRQRRPITTRQ